MRAACALVGVLVLFVSLVSGGIDGGLTFSLELGENRCFYEIVEDRDAKVYVHVAVQDGGHDLNLMASGPHDFDAFDKDQEIDQNDKSNTIFEQSLQQVKGEQRLLFVSQKGHSVYRVCVTNGAVMMKSVSINIKSADPGRRGVGPLKPMEPIQRTIIRLSESLHSIKEEQITLRVRERIHRETAETTYERVVFWSLVGIVTLLSMGIGQVWYYYRLFGGSSVRSRGV